MALQTKARTKAAELEARKALAESRAAVKDLARATRDLAGAMAGQVRAAGLDERAGQLVERVRDSEVVREAQSRGAELAARARDAAAQAQLDRRVGEMAARLRDTDAAELARNLGDDAFSRTGAWLASGRTGEKLGLAPRRGFPWWLAALLGTALGYAVALATATRRGEELREQVGSVTERLGDQAARKRDAPSSRPLAERVRQRLREDPRTAELGALNVNVVEGTVFVRGGVPASTDEASVREVVGAVEGVSDVDVQLNATT